MTYEDDAGDDEGAFDESPHYSEGHRRGRIVCETSAAPGWRAVIVPSGDAAEFEIPVAAWRTLRMQYRDDEGRWQIDGTETWALVESRDGDGSLVPVQRRFARGDEGIYLRGPGEAREKQEGPVHVVLDDKWKRLCGRNDDQAATQWPNRSLATCPLCRDLADAARFA